MSRGGGGNQPALIETTSSWVYIIIYAIVYLLSIYTTSRFSEIGQVTKLTMTILFSYLSIIYRWFFLREKKLIDWWDLH